MTRRFLGLSAGLLALGLAIAGNPGDARAAAAAATICPPIGFVNDVNLAANPSFESVGPNGTPTTWNNGDPAPPPSAAANWFMHSSNAGATVTSELMPTYAPGANGFRMLHFRAGGNEGGVYQVLQSPPAKVMFSAWVFVRLGQVVIQSNGGTTGPAAWTTKRGQWEQLRTCTDGTVPVDSLVIYNEDPRGGDFFVDGVELREIP
jgi:hypothetical protein